MVFSFCPDNPYHVWRLAQYEKALVWLEEYQRTLQVGDAPALDQPDAP